MESNINGKAGPSKRKTTWDNAAHEAFVQICLDEKRQENIPTAHFSKQGWLNVHPECAKFRDRGLEYTNEYEKLFQSTTAAGEDTWAPSSQLPRPHIHLSSTVPTAEEGINEKMDLPVEDEEDGDNFETPPLAQRTKKRRNGGRKGKEKKMGYAGKYLSTLERLVNVVESKSTVSSVLLEQQSYNVKAALALLREIPEITIGDPLYLFAADLFSKQAYREIFMELDNAEVRLGWLLMKKGKEEERNRYMRSL